MVDVTSTESLRRRLDVARRALDRDVGEARALATEGLKLQSELESLRASLDLMELARIFLTSIGEERQLDVIRSVESLVTAGLRTVLEEDLSFSVEQKVSAKQVGLLFKIRSTAGKEEVATEVLSARGGGVACVVGFLLKIVMLLLTKGSGSPIFLDETFAFLSVGHHERMSSFLRQLVDDTGVQIILVTHTPALAEYADAVYRFSLSDGVSSIDRIETAED